jgi:hypothetical protein
MEALDATPIGHSIQALAEYVVCSRTREKTAGEGPVVKARAADEDRQPVPGVNLADDARGVTGKARGGIDLRWIRDVDEVMRDAAALLEWQLVGADVEAAIDSGGIAVDDLAAVPLGERQAECAFTGCCRAEDRKDRRATYHPTRASTYTTSTVSTMSSPSCCVRVGIQLGGSSL